MSRLETYNHFEALMNVYKKSKVFQISLSVRHIFSFAIKRLIWFTHFSIQFSFYFNTLHFEVINSD